MTECSHAKPLVSGRREKVYFRPPPIMKSVVCGWPVSSLSKPADPRGKRGPDNVADIKKLPAELLDKGFFFLPSVARQHPFFT
ncbi:hypothetical protein CDAR_35421 [Caerostris darwini]|uniref:Uncharacterized protein n=1 Tax=Caerostris darwini TaxID=1538125 RepID=A0AAV4SK61_9ARAC|nr:hypothetical protein CDAR_35421 [Caerostris darwini]